jgi:CHAT domain-containing protein
MLQLILAALVFCASCTRPSIEDLVALHRQVQADIESGELINATAKAERGRALATERHDALSEWKFRLQQGDVLLFSRRAETTLTLIDTAIPQSPEFASVAARRLVLQSRAHSMLHHQQLADELLQRAAEAAEAAHAPEIAVDVETLRGNFLDDRGKYPESVAAWLRAREMARSVGSAYQEAGILINLGFARLRYSRFDEAAGFFEDASRIAGPHRSTLYSLAQQNLAVCYVNLGETDRAIQIASEAVARHERSDAKAYLASALGELGNSWLMKGDLRKAATYMDRALTLSLAMNATANAAVWASKLSNVYLELGDLANAESLNQESIRLRKTDKSSVLYYNELNAASIAMARGDLAEAARRFTAAMKDGKADPSVIWEAEEGLGTVALKEIHPAEAARHFEAAVEVVERTRSGLNRTEFKLPFLDRLIRLYTSYIDTLVDQGENERALAVADSSRAQVLAERSGADPVRRLPASAYRDIARNSGTVLLSYWLGPMRSHAWVVTGRETHHVELPPQREIEALVAAYKEAVERQLADPARTRLPAGERLFKALIEPVRKWIPTGSHVVVAPDGTLHGLNLEALPMPGDEPRYWVEDVTVSIAPSLAKLSARNGANNGKRLLLIGDPVGVDRSYPPLAYAPAEIAGITQRFGAERSVVISRERATPDAWRTSDPGGFSAIHFTAHATANRESPLDSAVLLAGGKLYARDVMATPLTADLVTVSACRGVGTRMYSGEGMVGFAWAFLHAGARNVIAGLWDVNDQSTSRLMDVLYRELAAGKGPADALHTAKLELVRSKGNLRKPYYWAPFQLYTVAP